MSRFLLSLLLCASTQAHFLSPVQSNADSGENYLLQGEPDDWDPHRTRWYRKVAEEKMAKLVDYSHAKDLWSIEPLFYSNARARLVVKGYTSLVRGGKDIAAALNDVLAKTGPMRSAVIHEPFYGTGIVIKATFRIAFTSGLEMDMKVEIVRNEGDETLHQDQYTFLFKNIEMLEFKIDRNNEDWWRRKERESVERFRDCFNSQNYNHTCIVYGGIWNVQLDDLKLEDTHERSLKTLFEKKGTISTVMTHDRISEDVANSREGRVVKWAMVVHFDSGRTVHMMVGAIREPEENNLPPEQYYLVIVEIVFKAHMGMVFFATHCGLLQCAQDHVDSDIDMFFLMEKMTYSLMWFVNSHNKTALVDELLYPSAAFFYTDEDGNLERTPGAEPAVEALFKFIDTFGEIRKLECEAEIVTKDLRSQETVTRTLDLFVVDMNSVPEAHRPPFSPSQPWRFTSVGIKLFSPPHRK